MKCFWSINVLTLSLFVMISCSALSAQSILESPNQQITVTIDYQDQLMYSVSYKDHDIIKKSPISLIINDGTILGKNCKATKEQKRTIKETITPVVAERRSKIINHCHEVKLKLDGNYGVIFRVYDDGFAWRFYTEFDQSIKIKNEQVTFSFTEDCPIFYPEPHDEFHCSFENLYIKDKVSSIDPDLHSFLPVMVECKDSVKVLITEVDLEKYPGLWLTRDYKKPTQLIGRFAPYPLEEKIFDNRTMEATKQADYIALCQGKRSFPWRAVAIVPEDGDLLESDFVYRLSPELAVEDTSWIKPGKVPWDWWNALNLWGVDFETGINTATYMHYIDFAAQNNLEYVILDEGWSELDDLLDLNPDVDLHKLIAYGKKKGVGIILWCVWIPLDRQMDKIMPIFKKWGVKGLKVDFMNRDDQKVVEFYERCVKTAAQNHLLVDLHGAYKPTGLQRAYPNLLTQEGVLGLEFNKWSDRATPEYAVTAPFIRMFAGPMDYTPGAMNNAQKRSFHADHHRPMSQGTRAHQMAQFVVFNSPLQMLADTPSAYRQNPECLEFLSRIPVTWDQTLALKAKVGDYLAVARRKDKDWYVGAMTDWQPREMTIDFGFLPGGKYTAKIISDGINADKIGIDYKHQTHQVSTDTKMKIKLAPGGGWTAHLIPVN